MQTLLDMSPTSEYGKFLQAGISPALQPENGLFWARGENVIFKDGGVKSGYGRLSAFRHTERIRAITQAFVGTGRIYFGTDNELNTWEFSAGITNLGDEFRSGEWALETWGKWLVATNGVDSVQLWKNNFAVKAGALQTPFKTAKIIKRLGPHLIAMNTNDGDTQIYWCSADNIEDWNIFSLENSAGEKTLRDLDSGIICAKALSDSMMIYTRDSATQLRWIGAPFVFGERKLFDNIGALSLDSVVTIDRRNFGWGPQGIWTTDGVSPSYIDEPTIRSFLQADLNYGHAHLIKGFHDEEEHQIIWFYPSGNSTENDRAVGFQYQVGSWTMYDYGMSAAVSRTAFEHALLGDDTSVYFFGKSDTADRAPFVTWVKTRPIDFGAPDSYKRIQGIRFGIRADGPVSFQLGSQDSLNDEVDWYYSGFVNKDVFIPDREVRFLTLKILAEGVKWDLSSLRILGTGGGFVI